MLKPGIFAFLILFFGLVQVSFAQDSRWYVDADGKLSVFNFTEAEFNGIEDYASSPQEYYFVDESDFGANFSYVIFYELGGGYELTPWLNGQLSVAYASGNEAGNGRRTIGRGFVNGIGKMITSEYALTNSALEIVPSVRIDVLPNSAYEDFSFIVGIGYGSINRQTTFNAQGRIDSDPVSQELIWEKHVEYLKLNLGIEWRDYFSPKFGYFLRLNACPGLIANTRKIEVEKFRVDDMAQPLEGQAIEPGENNYPEENHEVYFAEFVLGITYQF